MNYKSVLSTIIIKWCSAQNNSSISSLDSQADPLREITACCWFTNGTDQLSHKFLIEFFGFLSSRTHRLNSKRYKYVTVRI